VYLWLFRKDTHIDDRSGTQSPASAEAALAPQGGSVVGRSPARGVKGQSPLQAPAGQAR